MEVAITDAISGAMGAEGQFVTKWVALVEVANPEGEREMWSFTSEGMKPWDSLGMMTHAIHMEQATTVREGDVE